MFGRSLLVVVSVCAFTPARAAEAPSPIALRIGGTCPDEAAVRDALGVAAPALAKAGAVAGSRATWITILDRGTSVSIAVAGMVRTIEDPSRDCRERASAMALIAALAILPSERPSDGADGDDDDPKHGVFGPRPILQVDDHEHPGAISWSVRPRARRRTPWRIDLGAGAAGALSASVGSYGGALRFDAIRSWVGLSAGAGALATPTLTLSGNAQAMLVRVPIDMNAAAVLRRGAFELGGQLGVALIPFSAAGLNLAANGQGSGLDVALRAAAVARWRSSGSLSLSAGFELLYAPVPSTLAIGGRGDVGSTPQLSIGFGLGLGWRLL